MAPPYVDSFGPEAIDLARRAGLELDFWQQQAETLMLATREDGKWACFEYAEIVARQNGKGGILEARVLGGLFLFSEKLIMWSAHEYKTAMEAFLRVRALIRNLEDAGEIAEGEIKTCNTNGEESFERVATGQRLKFIARSKSSGRGFSGDVNIIDETFAYTPAQHAALMPTMNARRNPQIIYTSSPPLDPESGEVLFSLRDRALAGGDTSLGYRDWGIAGDLDNLDKIDLDDRANWAAANPALGIRITEETIGRNRRSMVSRGGVEFAREILGVWPLRRVGGGVIDVALWEKLADPASRREGDVALSVDIAPSRDYAAIGLYGLRADGLGHVQVVDYRPGTDWIVPRLVELLEVLDPVAIASARGTAASLETDLERVGITVSEDLDRPQRGDLVVLGPLDMAASCGQMIDAVRQGSTRHLGQEQLDAAVAGAKTRSTGDSVAWSRKDGDTDVSPLVVITQARWAFETRAHLVIDADYDVLDSIG